MSTRSRKAKAVADYVITEWGKPPLAVWSIPRTAEAYDAMVEQMVKEFIFVAYDRDKRTAEAMKASLRAIGITRPKETKP